jgi:autotransporter-associated beta strand protein
MTTSKNFRHQASLLALTTGLLLAAAAASAQNGTWTNLMGNGSASGSWSVATNWLAGAIAGGADSTADFSTLNITTNSVVTLDGVRTIGNLNFGSTVPAGTNNWILATGSAGPLTLATSSGQPTLNAVNGSNTITAVLVNTAVPSGLTKTGNGLIRLNSANLMTNVVNNINAGILQIGNNNALGYIDTANGPVVGSNNVVNGATLYVAGGAQGVSQRVLLAGAGQGGTNGALRADAGSGNQQNTRWSYALNSIANPAIVLNGDATIRVDGSGYMTQAGFLVGAITNNTSDLAYTLTLAGTGELRIDPGAEIAVSAINIAGGILGLNGNGPANITRTQVVSVASGAVIATRRNHTYNASGSFLTLNGTFDLNYNSGATANTSGNTWNQLIGSLQGSGTITNSSLAPQTLLVTSGTSNSIFGGTINPGPNGPITFRKEGQNTVMWLNGSSTFAGTNIMAGGIQYINGAWNPAGGFQVNAQSGATRSTLAGKGSTTSTITLGSGGMVSAGDPTSGGGTFSINAISASGAGDVAVSNANLTVSGTIGSASGYVNTLYLTNGTLALPLLPGGPSAFANTVTVDGKVALAYSSANPAVGQFPLIAYGSLNGLAGGGTNGITLVPPAGTSAHLFNNTANSTLDVVVTAVPALVWNGNINGNWDIGGAANWLNGATASTYTEPSGTGAFVSFDDTATGTTTVNLTTTVSPKGTTVNNSSKNYTFTGSGLIAGSAGLLKQGAGTLTLANSGTDTFPGPLTISAGSVQVGNGGTAGNLGVASVANSGQIIFNRSDDVTFANAITGPGSLVKNNTDTVTLAGIGDVGGTITANAGTLALAPAGTITVSGDVTGSGIFGINSAGKVVLTSGNVNLTGGLLIAGGGTLELDNAFPPSGSISDNGTLAFGVGGTLANNVSGTGGLTFLNGATVTLTGANTYAGPTAVLGGGSLTADAANYPPASMLILGSTNGAADIGSATFNSGNPVLGGLVAGGNNGSGNSINLAGSNPTLTINGNVYVGNTPSAASAALFVNGSGASVTVNTNGGLIQLGLGNQGSGVNPDNVLVDFSSIDNFTANLGATGTLNLGTLDGSSGPPAGASVVNQFKLANLSNSITAGTITVGAGGRQLNPELMFGAGTNIVNVNIFSAGGQGFGATIGTRDGSYVHFNTGSGGLRLRAADGISRAVFNVGVNPLAGTGANIVNTVDFSGHWVDLLFSTLTIGDYNNAGTYLNAMTFDTGTLDASSTSLSLLRNNNANAAASGSTLTINGGMASLGVVTLTASTAYGTLTVANATLATENISSPGAGASTLDIANSPWSLTLTNLGNPATAPVKAQTVNLTGTINLGVTGANWTVGQFPLISYTGSLGGDGYPALHLTSLPSGVTAHLSNNVTALSVDLVVTSAPLLLNTNPPIVHVAASTSTLSLGWPTNKGWILQSNSVGLTTSGAWFNYPSDGSVNATNVNITIQPGKTNVFFRMVKP